MAKVKHGDSHTKLHNRWIAMRQRCQNPNDSSYHLYGKRGISVCAEWQEYAIFKEWALANGYDERLSLDRIDVNGNYEPSNCRFVDAKTQTQNRRSNRNKTLWKPVEAIDNSGAVVKRFGCITDALRWLGVTRIDGNGISRTLHGRAKTAYGYRWRFAKE